MDDPFAGQGAQKNLQLQVSSVSSGSLVVPFSSRDADATGISRVSRAPWWPMLEGMWTQLVLSMGRNP